MTIDSTTGDYLIECLTREEEVRQAAPAEPRKIVVPSPAPADGPVPAEAEDRPRP